MWSHFISQMENSPHLFWVIMATALHILNSILGIAIIFRKISLGRVHLWAYLGVLVCLLFFFAENQEARGNGFVEWFVLVYFLMLIPLSRQWDILIHALTSTVGLTLLPFLILKQIVF